MSKDSKNNTNVSDFIDSIIIKPYVTEKAFNLVERENKLTFIVHENATKPKIIKAIKDFYGSDAIGVNTYRTIDGKKAIVKFKTIDQARELASKLGIV